MIKFYDTCSLLELQEEAFKKYFKISNITLIELEQIKTSGTRDEEIKWKARKVLHLLEEHEESYVVVIWSPELEKYLNEFSLAPTNDSKIVISAYVNNLSEETIFVTSDLACKTIAKMTGLETEFAKANTDDGYTGYKEFRFTEERLANFYNNVLPKNDNCYNLLTNQYLIIKDDDNNIIDKYLWYKTCYIKIPFIKFESKMFGKIAPKNQDTYQQLAMHSLDTNQITMLRGKAGSGKSYLAFGYMFSLLEKGIKDKIIVFANTVATRGSAKLGFYPGSRTEKLLDSQIGNLLISKLGDRIMVEKLIESNQLILLPFADIRGYDTTGMNACVYISEAQNLDIELIKLALQRIGEDSICIIDGDDKTQLDLAMYAGEHNGMKRVSKIFRGQDFYGEIELKNIYRSRIAEIAENL